MGADLTNPFGPACCEGSAAVDNTLSAQPCGCDKRAHWQCERHRPKPYSTERVKQAEIEARNAEAGKSYINDGPIMLPNVDKVPADRFKNRMPVIVGIGGAPLRASTLPHHAALRKTYPVASGVLDYFPDALVAVAHVSWAGNEQHNQGQPLHWAREKSTDEADTMMRHFVERGTRDHDGIRHSAKMVWRALALLQKEIESEQPKGL